MPNKGKTEQQTVVYAEEAIKTPNMYQVVMNNDDYTPMDFVVEVLMTIFHKSQIEAANIMMDVHNKGQGVAGVYTFDIATTKKDKTVQWATEKGFPLYVYVEEVGL